MEKQALTELLRNPSLLRETHRQELEKITTKYPYFLGSSVLLARLDWQAGLKQSKWIALASLNCPNRKALKKFITQDFSPVPLKSYAEPIISPGTYTSTFSKEFIDGNSNRTNQPTEEIFENITSKIPEAIDTEVEVIAEKAQTISSPISKSEFEIQPQTIFAKDLIYEPTQTVDSVYLENKTRVFDLAEPEDIAQLPGGSEDLITDLMQNILVYKQLRLDHAEELEEFFSDAPTTGKSSFQPVKEEIETTEPELPVNVEAKEESKPLMDALEETIEASTSLADEVLAAISHDLPDDSLPEPLSNEDQLISEFIKNKPKIGAAKDKVSVSEGDLSASKSPIGDEDLTENLAQIMVNQGKIDKAIEIYCKLILKNPEKTPYFAARINALSSASNL